VPARGHWPLRPLSAPCSPRTPVSDAKVRGQNAAYCVRVKKSWNRHRGLHGQRRNGRTMRGSNRSVIAKANRGSRKAQEERTQDAPAGSGGERRGGTRGSVQTGARGGRPSREERRYGPEMPSRGSVLTNWQEEDTSELRGQPTAPQAASRQTETEADATTALHDYAYLEAGATAKQHDHAYPGPSHGESLQRANHPEQSQEFQPDNIQSLIGRLSAEKARLESAQEGGNDPLEHTEQLAKRSGSRTCCQTWEECRRHRWRGRQEADPQQMGTGPLAKEEKRVEGPRQS